MAHVIFGINVLDMLGYGEDENIVFSVVCALAFFTGSSVFAFFWKKRWEKGPMEWVMRRFSDFSVSFMTTDMKTS